MKCPDCGELKHQGECHGPLPDLLEETIYTIQQVLMAHPDSSERSVAIHQALSPIRFKLVKFMQHYYPKDPR